ncbi:Outer membrane porin protein 32 [Paraburkholderia domus]|uniref:porin n=1 Tax=Paraburkholderia domus TaxID=2793075 RepID=UPI001913FC1B|nr:porin [Paraburkholderia domus]MBK5091768.1 porin [Burkholderia sp. R-69927]CAE6942101.1 Outer membrane porin protein 32 [Paraburkholderia domus]
MKACRMLACLLFCGVNVAHAQSSVTLYGIIDEFVQYANTGRGYSAAVQSSGQWASRFGLRGSEDIGAGTKINFVLENGFVPNTGGFADPTSIFNRQAWVGASGGWGEVRLGRLNSPLFITEWRVDAFAAVTQASGLDNLSTYTIRTSNTAAYISPTYAGLQASVYAGLGTSGGFREPGSNYQFSVTYDHGPVAASYAQQAVWSATGNALDKSAFASLSYAFSSATVYLGYHSADWANINIKIRAYSLSMKYQFTPASFLSLGGAYLHDRTSLGNDAGQISAMYQYLLSKRTNVYAAVSFLKNKNTSSRTLAGAANAGPALAYPGADARGIQVGFVQKF